MATNPNPQRMYIEYKGKKYHLREEDGTIIGVYDEDEIISLIHRIRERSPRILDEDADRLLMMINKLSDDVRIIRMRDYIFDYIHDDIDFDSVDFEDAVYREIEEDEKKEHIDHEDVKRPDIEEGETVDEENLRDVTPKDNWLTKFGKFLKGLTKKGLITIGAAVVLLFIILKFSISSPEDEQAPADEQAPQEQVAKEQEVNNNNDLSSDTPANATGEQEKNADELLKRTQELEQPETAKKEDNTLVAKEQPLETEGSVTNSKDVVKAILNDVNKQQVRLTNTTQQEIELISGYLQGNVKLMQVRAKVNINKTKKEKHAEEVEKALERLDSSYDKYKSLTRERMQIQLDMHEQITAADYDEAELSIILQQVVARNEEIRQQEIRALADALIHNDIPFTTDETGVVIE